MATHLERFLEEQRKRKEQHEKERQEFRGKKYDFSLSPEAQAVERGDHKVDLGRINQLETAFDTANGMVGPYERKRSLDQSNIRDAASALGKQIRGHNAGGVASNAGANIPKEKDPDEDPLGKWGHVIDAGVGGLSMYLANKSRKSRKKAVRDTEGNIVKDSEGNAIMERKHKGSNLGTMAAFALPGMAAAGKEVVRSILKKRQENRDRERAQNQGFNL